MSASHDVIDLTGDDDEDASWWAGAAASSSSSAPTGGAARAVSLSGNAASRKRGTPSFLDRKKPPPPPSQHSSSAAATKRFKSVKDESTTTATGDDVAVLQVDDDDDDGDFKISSALRNDEDDDEDEDVEVVDRPATMDFCPAVAATAAASSAGNNNAAAAEDGVELVGTMNSTRLSHMRQHCTEHPFAVDPQKHCPECYCYVCDVPASECRSWMLSHCRATNTGPDARLWKHKRDQAKARSESSAWNSPTMAGAATASAATASNEVAQTLNGEGPWDPTNPVATAAYIAVTANSYSAGHQLVKCRHCGWYSRNKRSSTNPPSCLDWCYACGRVGDPRALLKDQGKRFKPDQTNVRLGSKTFPFRLHTHDPRKMKEFEARWSAHEGKDEGWTYNEVDMEQELFDHRFGKRPRLERILASVPVFRVDKIPVDGARMWEDADDVNTPPAVETEAILLDANAIRVLDSLYSVCSGFGRNIAPKENGRSKLEGNIVATWNKESRTGELVVEVYHHGGSPHVTRPECMNRFLGCWFGCFPFPLHDICGALQPSDSGTVLSALKDLSDHEQTRARSASAIKYSGLQADPSELTVALDSLKVQCDAKASSRSLTGSSASSQLLGGMCQSEIDFSGVLKRYYAETFAEVVSSGYSSNPDNVFLEAWCMNQLGIDSHHRRIRTTARYENQCEANLYDYHGTAISTCMRTMWTVLDPMDAVLALSFRRSANSLTDQVTSLENLMLHLENRGHPEVTAVDGLTVELLPFQKQSVQWAKERELVAGGIQRFLWAKIPRVDDDLYYCPLLGRFSKDQPHLVRGGIIGEMMGLGKTVISLATILANPAPLLPESGSKSDTIPSLPDVSGSFRDPSIFEKRPTTALKRGSIVSRGTLVVCNVSLVGQWVDEAKSKLKNPGLVYSYHGYGRKRNPLILAMNSIVVTTYETLASDATYHRKKSDEDEYCPPCEQIRWWRIICDESHVLRHSNNCKSNAVMNLVADNKWLVSGTPVNTTLLDLENQFRFLGIQEVPQLMRHVRESTCRAIQDKGTSGSRKNDYSGSSHIAPVGRFTFLTREILMRHAHDQKYTGTTTTLMSLPPKSERSVLVAFSSDERAEYAKLESEALDFYTTFRCMHEHELQKHYLKLTQRLMTMRIACAGGRIPLYEDDEDQREAIEDEDSESDFRPRKKSRKPTTFSEFAYTSKLNALIGELERVKNGDPSAKSLVFSQFTSTLDWLKLELPRRGFQFRTLSGDMPMSKRKKALQDFQNDPPTTVFLLSMRAGAVGINLTQANRVFIMEPFLNPALEAQAIGRVHRLGQKRPVEIIRLIVANSIETRLQSVLAKRAGGKKPSDSVANARVASEDSDDDDDEGWDKKLPAVGNRTAVQPVAAPLIGSISSDKAIVAAEEFDTLYGFVDRVSDIGAGNDDERNVC